MIFKDGPLIGDARGSAGGITVSKNAYGNFIRKRSAGKNPGTILQLSQRGYQQYLLGMWSTLIPSDVLSWNNLAPSITYYNRLGIAYHLSGQALFLKYNLDLFLIGVTAISTAPDISDLIPPLPHVPSVVIDLTPGSENVTISFLTPIAATSKLALYGSNVMSTGRTRSIPYKFIAYLDSTAVSPFAMTALFRKKFQWPVAIGSKVYFKTRDITIASGYSAYPEVTIAIATI